MQYKFIQINNFCKTTDFCSSQTNAKRALHGFLNICRVVARRFKGWFTIKTLDCNAEHDDQVDATTIVYIFIYKNITNKWQICSAKQCQDTPYFNRTNDF